MSDSKKSTDFWVASTRDMTGLIPAGPVDEEELEMYEDLYPVIPSNEAIKAASGNPTNDSPERLLDVQQKTDS